MDFVEICNVYVGEIIIKAAKRILNSDKICRSYSDLNFGVTFFGTQCMLMLEGRINGVRTQGIGLMTLKNGLM